jgi:hypothetical protein
MGRRRSETELSAVANRAREGMRPRCFGCIFVASGASPLTGFINFDIMGPLLEGKKKIALDPKF